MGGIFCCTGGARRQTTDSKPFMEWEKHNAEWRKNFRKPRAEQEFGIKQYALFRELPNPPEQTSGRMAFLVRTHNATPSMIYRMFQWYNDLWDLPIDFHISVDTTQ